MNLKVMFMQFFVNYFMKQREIELIILIFCICMCLAVEPNIGIYNRGVCAMKVSSTSDPVILQCYCYCYFGSEVALMGSFSLSLCEYVSLPVGYTSDPLSQYKRTGH